MSTSKFNGVATAKTAARRASKKKEITLAAISLLSTLGFAKCTLRDIAKGADVSLGVLHYYFEDKEALIAECVRLYKEEFGIRIAQGIMSGTSGESVRDKVIEVLAKTIKVEGARHRLWYDIRAQAFFDTRLLETVAEVETGLIKLTKNLLTALGLPGTDPRMAYMAFDGFFRLALQLHLAGDTRAVGVFKRQMREFLVMCESAGPRAARA